MRIKVEDTDYTRDLTSMGLINNNVTEYNAYIERRARLLENKKRSDNLVRDVEELKSDIEEIKGLLQALARK